MKRATISNLKNQLSQFLRFVRQGETVLVLDRGIPVASLQPVSSKKEEAQGRLERLEASGILRRGDPKRLKDFSFPDLRGKSGVLERLLEEREQGR